MSGDGIQTDPEKIEKIKNWPKPNDSDKLEIFYGFCRILPPFCEGFFHINKTPNVSFTINNEKEE